MDTIKLRQLYYEAASDKKSAELFSKTMAGINTGADPLLQCYKGMAYLIRANQAFNPYTKLNFFNKGKELLEKSIHQAPDNIEIRFMRFSVQTNAPFFLGYSSHVDSDKKVILTGWKEIKDQDLKQRIRTYLLESNQCTELEKTILK